VGSIIETNQLGSTADRSEESVGKVTKIGRLAPTSVNEPLSIQR